MKDIIPFQHFEAVNIQKEPSTSGFSLDPSPSSTQTRAHMVYIFIFLKLFAKSEGALSVKISMFIIPPRPISSSIHPCRTHLSWCSFSLFPLPLATLILENKPLRMDNAFFPFPPFPFPWASPGVPPGDQGPPLGDRSCGGQSLRVQNQRDFLATSATRVRIASILQVQKPAEQPTQ